MPVLTYNFRSAGAGSVESNISGIDRASKKAASREGKRSKKLQRNRARARLRRIRESKRGAAQEVREAERASKRVASIHRKADRTRARMRLKALKDKRREMAQVERLESKRLATRRKARGRRGGAIASAGLGAVGAVGAAAAAATVGVGLVAARQKIGLDEKSRALAIQSRDPGEKLADPKKITRDAQDVALRVGGTTAESVIDAMTTFVTRTGRADLAQSMAETFAVTAKATGAGADDIAGAAADLFQKFDITGIEEMQEALAALTFQGKKGAFELKDAAAQFPKLAAAAQRLGIGKGAGAVKTLGGLTQLARGSTGSAEAAATSLEALFTGLTTKQSQLKKAGVKVFDEKGQARDIQSLLVDVISKVGGKDVGAKKGELSKIFGRQGIRAISPLIDAYATATAKGADGAKAVAAALNDAIDAPGTWSDVVEDAALANETASARLTTAWEKIVAASGDELAPALENLIKTVTSAEGIDAVKTAFAGLATATNFLADTFGFLAQSEANPHQLIKVEKEKQAKLQEQIEAKNAARADINLRSVTGQEKAGDQARIDSITQDISKLVAKRDVSVKEENRIQDQLDFKGEQNRLLATKVEGKTGTETFFNRDQFMEAFVGASGLPADFRPDLQRQQAENVLTRLQEGKGINETFLTENQRDIAREVGGQVKGFQSGIGFDTAPSDAIGGIDDMNAAGVAMKVSSTGFKTAATAFASAVATFNSKAAAGDIDKD